MQVIKRDGKVTEFDVRKIYDAVLSAAKDTKGVKEELAKKITGRLTGQVSNDIGEMSCSIIEVEEIQDIIEKELMKVDGDIAKNFIIYRYQHKKIRNINQEFDSAIEAVTDYVNRDDWEVHENSNMGYSLQGLNNHISAKVTEEFWLQEIYTDKIEEVHKKKDLHIHDLDQLSVYCCGYDVKDLLLNGFCGVEHKVESAPPKHFDTALMQSVNFLYTVQGEASGAQAFSSFDTYLAPFIAYDDLNYVEVKQKVQQFIYNLNVPTRVGFQSPFVNLTLDLTVPETMEDEPVIIDGKYQDTTYNDFQDEMDMFNRAFAEVMIEGDKKNRVFTFPIPTYNITSDFNWDNEVLDPIWEMTAKFGIPYFSNFINSDMDPSDVRSMCCRLRLNQEELKKRGGGLFGSNPQTGSIGVVTLNMPRVGKQAETKDEFLERVEELMNIAKDSLERKREVLEKLMKQGLYPYAKFYLRQVNERFDEYWQNHFSTIGILGMNEALVNFMDENMGTEAGREFSLEVTDFMREKLKEYQEETGNLYNLEATPGESTTYRFAKSDKEKFGDDIICANEGRVRKQNADPYYTNSTQLPVGYTDDIFTALDLQDEILCQYTGGCVHHGFVGERMPDIESTKKLVKRIAENYELPYYSITPTFSICPEHGYIAGEHEFCPKCDAEMGYTEEDDK